MKGRLNLINNKGQETVTYIPTLTLGWSRYNYRKLTIDTRTDTQNKIVDQMKNYNGTDYHGFSFMKGKCHVSVQTAY